MGLCADTSLVLSCGCGGAVGLCVDTLLLLYCVVVVFLSPSAVSPVCGRVVLFWPVPLSPSSAPGAALCCPPPGVYSRAELFSLLHTVVAGQV